MKFLRREVPQRGQYGGGYSNENRENNSGGGSQQGYSGFNRRSARDGNMRGGSGGNGSQNLKWQAMNNFAQATKYLSRYFQVYLLLECSGYK